VLVVVFINNVQTGYNLWVVDGAGRNTFTPNNNNNKVCQSKASWGRLELKPTKIPYSNIDL
jgi:hypothetical protein